MNRVIKFRAWHYHKNWSKDGKPLEPGMEYDFWISSNGPVSFPEGGWDINSIEKPDTLVLMQYTGLLDKNGKEIYEGDIVETPHKLMKKYKWQVIFHKGAFVLSDSIGFRYFYGKKYTQKYGVIGNIYENPELMK